jgi:hypothetical protein
MLFVVLDLFNAALAACLCGWRIRSALHGTADNDDGHGDDATRLPACVWRRVLGGFGGRPLGRRAQQVRSCLDLAAWSAGVWLRDGLPGPSCWWRPRRWRPRCCGTSGRGWVDGQVAMQCVGDSCCCGGGRCVRLPASGVGHVSQHVCVFARCQRRPMYEFVLLFVKIAPAAAAAAALVR